jgi:phage tail-like protein
MPSIFQDDAVTGRFCAGLDDVLAPVFATLDCLDAYVDPAVAPTDFLEWLAGWVGAEIVEDWPVERKRLMVSNAVDLFSRRGTVDGLREELQLYTGAQVEIADSGGVAFSLAPGGDLPGAAEPRLVVTITADDPASVREARVQAIVAASKPANVVHEVEIVRGSRG